MSIRRVGGIDLWLEEGRNGDQPTLLLMHGLSGTGDIWQGLKPILAEKWPGRWIIPDMRGHGRSGHSTIYGIANHAMDMAALMENTGETYLAGHSMGGLVGILLASGWFGVLPKAVVTAGVKVTWTSDEHAALSKLIDTPARWFDTEQEARERFIRVTGLSGVVDATSNIADGGILENDGKWRLSADNRTAMVAFADATDIYNSARVPVVLAAGEHDQMVNVDDLRTLDPGSRQLPGLGHNAHVENPDAFWSLISEASGIPA
ncbi:MAG: alpha/beta hydrolase [Pseudomonadota bacterium]|nr:alpha/beta hydrolase [Pseudomonadota bacterium]